MDYVIVDIETTGGSPKQSKITEIALFKHNGHEIVDSFSTLLDPEIDIPAFIVRLTGINNSMVQGAPKFYEIAKTLIEFTQDCIFVAHNVGFDYGIIRQEFKSLGFDYRRPHLCTVRASRYVIPGMSSYSLGKLSKELGITINDRHRAAGDALATAHLFTLLYQKDATQLNTFIQHEVNPKILHPTLNLDILDEIPSKTGVYKFYNENNQLIYIGKSKQIKQRIEQHLRNTTTKKGIKMREEIARIEFELTGSELIALLQESQLIKKHQPIYNQKLKKSRFPFGIYDYQDESGYIRFFIGQTSKRTEQPIASFTTKKEAVEFLSKKCEAYELCQKMCDLYPTQSACFHHSIKKCKGACVAEEKVDDYNSRVDKLIQYLSFNGESFYIVDKGRVKGEKSLVLIEQGTFIGFGYSPYHFNGSSTLHWKRFIDVVKEDRDIRTILGVYLRKKESGEIVKL